MQNKQIYARKTKEIINMQTLKLICKTNKMYAKRTHIYTKNKRNNKYANATFILP